MSNISYPGSEPYKHIYDMWVISLHHSSFIKAADNDAYRDGILALEPLAQLIKLPNINSVKVAAHYCKICLFAGHILLCLSSPILTLPNLIQLFSKLGDISCLWVNPSNPKVHNTSLPPDVLSAIHSRFPFKLASYKLIAWILGIFLANSYNNLYQANHSP